MAVIGGYSIDKALNMDYADDEQELRMRLIQSTTVFFFKYATIVDSKHQRQRV